MDKSHSSYKLSVDYEKQDSPDDCWLAGMRMIAQYGEKNGRVIKSFKIITDKDLSGAIRSIVHDENQPVNRLIRDLNTRCPGNLPGRTDDITLLPRAVKVVGSNVGFKVDDEPLSIVRIEQILRKHGPIWYGYTHGKAGHVIVLTGVVNRGKQATVSFHDPAAGPDKVVGIERLPKNRTHNGELIPSLYLP